MAGPVPLGAAGMGVLGWAVPTGTSVGRNWGTICVTRPGTAAVLALGKSWKDSIGVTPILLSVPCRMVACLLAPAALPEALKVPAF